MADTAQPETAAETEVSTADAIEAAANAFKTFNPEATETLERPRDEQGKFVSTKEEIEAEEPDAELAEESEAESHDEEETGEAADEAQPEAVDLPTSWPAELAEEWQSLPAAVQDTIVRREAERDTAVNAKFQEAANVRKANEAVIAEANTSRQKYAEAADFVMSLVEPTPPSTSMLQPGSSDYNPDAYHLRMAEYHQQRDLLTKVQQQREQALAQLQTEAEAAERQVIDAIEARTRPVLLKDVPELADPQKQSGVLQGLVHYAVAQGIPETVFTDPEVVRGVTSAQLHLLWKAQQFDKMNAAKAKVQPKAAKPAAPAVRPGVATSRSANEAAQRKKAFERLDREGSVEAAAAIFKMQSKGNFR
jgi:hypothetical protein